MKTKTKKVSTKTRKKKSESKPLTLEMLDKYTQRVLLPALEEKFATKKELSDFKNSSLTNQDALLKNQGILLTEKEVDEYQKEKEKKLWIIVINSLREHRILSSGEMEKISKLDVL